MSTYGKDIQKLKTILDMDGSCVSLNADQLSGVEFNRKDGILSVGTRFVDGPDIGAATHELGHLMVARDENIGSDNWGLQATSFDVFGGLIYKALPTNVDHFKTEARVWTWQHLMECELDSSRVATHFPDRPEVRFLDGCYLLGATEHEQQAALRCFQQDALSAICAKYADPMEALRERIRDVPRLLRERLVFEHALEMPGEEERIDADGNGTSVCLYRYGNERTEPVWCVSIVTECDQQNVVTTRDHRRACRLYDKFVGSLLVQPEETAAHRYG